MEIRMDFAGLQAVKNHMYSLHDRVQEMVRELEDATDDLQRNGWMSYQARDFYETMDIVVLPETWRLVDALERTAACCEKLQHHFEDAEKEAISYLTSLGGIRGKRPAGDWQQEMPTVELSGEESTNEIRAMLLSAIWARNHLMLDYFVSRYGSDASINEMLAFIMLMESYQNDGGQLAWRFILEDPIGYFSTLGSELHEHLPELLNQTYGNYDPLTAAQSWEAFHTWLQEEGIRNIEIVDITKSFEDWVRGEGSFWQFALTAGPMSGPTANRILNAIDLPENTSLRRLLEGVADGTRIANTDDLMRALNEYDDATLRQNLARLGEVSGEQTKVILGTMNGESLVRFITDPHLLNGLPDGAGVQNVIRHVNVAILSDTIDGFADLPYLNDLDWQSTENLTRALNEVPEPDLTALNNLADRLDGTRANDMLANLDDASVKRLLESSTIARGDEVPGLENATYDLTKNTGNGENIAAEMVITGKSDPNLGVFVDVPGLDNPVEIDWAVRNDNGTVSLVDAKNISFEDGQRSALDIRTDQGDIWPGQNEQIRDEMLSQLDRQLQAMQTSGADEVVWHFNFATDAAQQEQAAFIREIETLLTTEARTDSRYANVRIVTTP